MAAAVVCVGLQVLEAGMRTSILGVSRRDEGKEPSVKEMFAGFGIQSERETGLEVGRRRVGIGAIEAVI